MNIQEATRIALETNKCIARKSCCWQVKPTNKYLFLFDPEEMEFSIPWLLKSEDLMADDWEVVC